MTTSPTEFIEQFVSAMNRSEIANLVDLVHPDVVAYVTNASGGSTEVRGREDLMTHLPDFAAMADSFDATIRQIHRINADTALFMIEIEATRLGLTLHNFAGIYVRLQDSQMIEYRMVEALPKYSDEFWSAE